MLRFRALAVAATAAVTLVTAAPAGAQAGPVESWRRSPAFAVERYASGVAHASWAAPANPAADHWDAWVLGPVSVLVDDVGQGTIVWPCGALATTARRGDRSATAAGPGGSMGWASTGQTAAESLDGAVCGVRLYRD